MLCVQLPRQRGSQPRQPEDLLREWPNWSWRGEPLLIQCRPHHPHWQVVEYLSSSRSGAPVLAVIVSFIAILMSICFWTGWNILGWDHPGPLSGERGRRRQSWGSTSCVRQTQPSSSEPSTNLDEIVCVVYMTHFSQTMLPVCFDTFEGCNSLEGDWLNRQLNRYQPI